MQVVMKFEGMVGIEDTETTRESLCILRGSRRESGSLSRPLVRNNENKERRARSGDNVKCVLRRRTTAGQNAVLKVEGEGAYSEPSIATAPKRLVDLFVRTKDSHPPSFINTMVRVSQSSRSAQVCHVLQMLDRAAMHLPSRTQQSFVASWLTGLPCRQFSIFHESKAQELKSE